MGRYPEIEHLVKDVMGLDIESIGERAFEKAVARVLADPAEKEESTYSRLLVPGSRGLTTLIERLVVPETWFFRDRGTFECLLSYVSSEWVEKGRRDSIRVLSAPCSTGEEAFSIVMVLIKAGLQPDQIQVEGVDISTAAILAASAARYGSGSFRRELEEWQARCFLPDGPSRVLSDDIRRLVRFTPCNLVQPGALAGTRVFDVIFCKNLMIYLAPEARARLLANLSTVLRPGGYLFAGHSEVTIFQNAGYQPVGFPRSFAVTSLPAVQEPRQARRAPVPRKVLRPRTLPRSRTSDGPKRSPRRRCQRRARNPAVSLKGSAAWHGNWPTRGNWKKQRPSVEI